MKKKFIIIGEPKGKGRPRFGKGRTYTPKDTVDYENTVSYEYQRQCGSYNFSTGGEKVPIAIIINAFAGVPKSVSKKKSVAMVRGKIKPTKKPDLDNIAKIIMDGLNGIAYTDDSQVVSMVVNKRYATEPYVEVVITEFNEMI